MPEIRKDPIVGRWIVVATERAQRPKDFSLPTDEPGAEKCPFCEGNEKSTPEEVFALRKLGARRNGPGWQVRIVPSIHPALERNHKLNRRGVGMYDEMDGRGIHEVVIETPEHIARMSELASSQIEKVIAAYVSRINEIEENKNYKYVLIFKNCGVLAGASSIAHSHSQLIAMPVNPKVIKKELSGAKKYYAYKGRCIFCDIIEQELKEEKRVIEEGKRYLVVTPFAPRFPFEAWILPKRHCADFCKISHEEQKELAGVLKSTLVRLDKALANPPYNYMIHTAPFRRQTAAGYWRTINEDYHWHLEIMPRLVQVAGFEWGTGCYINPTPPELAAEVLRKVEV